MKKKGRTNRGFTLTEVLVASVLLGAVLTGIYVLFSSTIVSWQVVDTPWHYHQNMRRIAAILERDLHNTIAGTIPNWAGAQDEITCYAATRPLDRSLLEGTGVLEIRYHYDARKKAVIRDEAWIQDPGMHTALIRADHPGDAWKKKNGTSHVLAPGVTSFSIRYLWYARLEANDAPGEGKLEPLYTATLSPEWGSPDALEFTLVFQPPSDTKAPPVVTLLIPLWSHAPEKRPDAALMDSIRRAAV